MPTPDPADKPALLHNEESTTPGAVELARLTMEAVNTRDLDAWELYFAPDVVIDLTRTVGVVIEGREANRRFLEDWLVGYDGLEYSTEELVDLGNGVGFAVVVQSARPAGTTGYVRSREGFVGVFDDGLVTREIVYPRSEIDEARAVAERLAQERADG
jgi:ketosteroid isomerase-like protein